MSKQPIPGRVYTLRALFQLHLLDSPHLIINAGVIQTSHLMEDELLSVPGLADTEWRYTRTTHEWIPLFHCVDNAAVLQCVDIRPSLSEFDGPDAKWITPKGFPRLQYEEHDHA